MVGKDIRAQVFHSIQVKVLATFLLILLPVYVLGAVIFHWTYLQMHQQIIRSQMALLNLYAETIDDEIQLHQRRRPSLLGQRLPHSGYF